MTIKSITKSDSSSLIAQCGFQPTWVYCGISGTIVAHTNAGDDITINVQDGQWFPGDAITLIKAASTAGGFIGRK